MTNATLLGQLQRTGRDRSEPLHVLVVHDGLRARQRVERLLGRIRSRLGGSVRMACAYQRLEELRHRDEGRPAPRIEVVFLAASCSATLPRETLAAVTSLLPSVKANRGAVAFLSGTNAPRQVEAMLVEQFLRTHSERAGVALFSGHMPGLGCPGCITPKPEKSGRSGAKQFCVLHAPRKVRAATRPGFSKKSKPTKIKTPPARRARAKSPARGVANRKPRPGHPGPSASS